MKKILSIFLWAYCISGMAQPNVTLIEYFIDTDPGRGNGTPVSVSNPTINILENVSTSTLSLGFHVITVRAQDENGVWGQQESKPFYVGLSSTATQNAIVAMEYFIDTDPGRGSGVTIPISPSMSLDILENVPTSSLTEGFHVITVRARDERGNWGLAESKPFYVNQSTGAIQNNITMMEYFIDADPGRGLGVNIPISPSMSLDILENVPTSSLATGFHVITVRARDERGIWGLSESKPFVVLPSEASNLVAVEYFIDADPGIGSGISIPLSPAPNINMLHTISTNTLSDGFHTISIRAQDDNGVWGHFESKPFFVSQSSTASQNNITSLEYYFDEDPGVGNGTSITVTTGTSIMPLEELSLASLANGHHVIFIRAQDENGEWGQVESRSFFIDQGRQLINYEYALDTDPGIGLATQHSITPPQDSIDETLLIDTTPLSIGSHNLIVRVEDNHLFWSKTSVVPFIICDGGVPNFVADDACLGSATIFTDLSTNTQAGDTYSWDFDGDFVEDDNTTGSTSFTYPSAGSFTAILTLDRSGCSGSFTLIVTVVDLPIAPTGTDQTICAGETATLVASGGTNGQYRWYVEATGNTLATPSTSDTFITPILTSSITYYVAIDNGTCESTRTPFAVTVTNCNNPPVINVPTITIAIQGSTTIDLLPFLSDPDDNLDTSSLTISAQPQSGAVASLSGTQLSIDYTNINFAGLDFLSISVCDFTPACATQQLTIEVIGAITIYNALSPGSDGKNDIFFIEFIDILASTKNNKVTIFDRWGSVVWTGTNYDNATIVFKGTSKDGKELPTGTYFYRIDFKESDSRTGYISLKR